MFCCDCGAPNPETATYCHKCGRTLYKIAAGKLPLLLPSGPKPEPKLTREQQQLVDALFSIDKKPHECHACGRTENLYGWDFGLGKKTGSNRGWDGIVGIIVGNIVINAVTVPLLGVGVGSLPGKKTTFNVLQLKLILCDTCRSLKAAYHFHPWWEQAKLLGFTEFFDAQQLKMLQPVS